MRKRLQDPWLTMLRGHTVLTAYGAKKIRKQRARNKVAKQARKANRA